MNLARTRSGDSPWVRLGVLAVFAAAMGMLEAICVIYLRWAFPASTHFLPPPRVLQIEALREACTIIMIVGAGWLGGFNAHTRLASFVLVFGVWDIVYYLGLWWPGDSQSGLLDWDLLFLIPEHWYGPILAPVLISVYFVAACVFVHWKEEQGTPFVLSARNLMVQLVAAAVWYLSFVKDSETITKHGFEGVSYSWPLFALGMGIALAGLLTGSSVMRGAGSPRANAVPS